MAILQKLGAAIKALLGRSEAAAVDKTELLTTIETLLQTANSVKDALQQPTMIKALSALRQVGVKDVDADLKRLQKIYQVYFHTLPAKWQQAERDRVFATIMTATGEIETDLALLRENFAELFGGVTAADLPVKEMTVTSAAVVGRLNLIDQYFAWVIYFIGNISNDGVRVPPYQLNLVEERVESVARYTVALVTRPTNETIMTVLEAVRRAGADLYLTTDGHTIDSYASDNQYSPAVMSALSGFTTFNPILAVGNMVNQHRQLNYERAKARREWLASKVGYLTLQAQGLDPDSPEAKRLAMLTARYAEMVAQYDKKLGTGHDE